MPPRTDNALAAAFGRKLRAARLIRGLTQTQLAGRSRLCRNAIEGVENGRHGVSLVTLYALAVALNVSPAELLPEVDAPE